MNVIINAQWQASGNGQAYPIGAERIRSLLCPSLELITPGVSYKAANFEVKEGVRNQPEILASLDVVSEALSEFSTPIFNLGCDCGGEFVPVAKLNERFGGDLRVIWFDAHPDLNTVQTSPSHTFHGMVLRALLGDVPSQFDRFLRIPLKPENVILAGARSIDTGEHDFINSHPISVISPDELNSAVDASHLKALEGGPVYVHVDYDVLDPEHHPNAIYQAEGGVSLQMLLEWLYGIRQSQNVVGFSLTEFAPQSPLSSNDDVQAILSSGFGLPVRQY